MYRRKLIVSLCILVAIILLLSGISLWAHQNSELHTQRNRIANQMLTEFISLRADKQRLKVWLAEYLLTDNTNTDFRDMLFGRMRNQLNTLEQLAIRDQLYSTGERDLQHIMQQVKVVSLLQNNVTTLEQALRTREIENYENESELWSALITLFDKFQDTDLSALLQDAIAAQKLRAKTTEEEALHAVTRIQSTMLLISLAGLFFAVVIGWRLSLTLSRALQHLLDGTKQLQHGNFDHRIVETDPSEFAELARQFNMMSGYIAEFTAQEKLNHQATEELVHARTGELQQTLNQLHESERRQKQLLTDISHELRTPATSIQGEAEISLRGKDRDIGEYKESFRRIVAATSQLTHRIDDLLMLARGDDRLLQLSLKPIGLREYIAIAEETIRQQLRGSFSLKVSAALSLPEDAWLLIDSEKFASVLRIVTDNAQHYSPDDKVLHLATSLTEHEFVLTLSDQGIGVEPEDEAHLFQRHFRSTRARQQRAEGLGIGLCIARSVVEAHDGFISLLPNSPKGTTVRITLPWFNGAFGENTDH